MSATSLTFNVTDSSTGAVSDISAIDIVLVTANGSGANIQYMTNGAVPGTLLVTETPLAISTASKYLIALTDTATSGVFYVNVDRIQDVVSNGSASNVYFNAAVGEARIYAVNESRTAIRTAIAAVVSSGSNPVTTGLTAGTTQTQVGATALSYGFNEVTTVAVAGDGVRLPAAIIGGTVTVLNDGANTMQVYPPTSGKINDGSVNASINQAPGVELVYVNIDGTNWESNAQTVSATRVITGAGSVSAPGLVVGANDNGQYEVSSTQQGFSIGNTLVGGYDANGLFTGTITEQVVGAGIVINHIEATRTLADATTRAYNVASTTSVATATNLSTMTVNQTMTGASAVNTVEVAQFVMTSNVLVGNWANAVLGKLNFSTSGSITGLAGVFCGELDMSSAGAPAGTYTVYEAEINMAGATTVPISAMCVNVWGAQAASFDTNGYLFDITGLTKASGKVFQDNTAADATQAIRIRVNGTPYYMMLTSVGA